ncbi:uncharacterized protein SPSK_02478 [Sporothrix schenckii 1099-18]|uniref:Uncharacterized protein n=1 Tax=Sporothrix schenckii 1099-18 TaxID=1397361 RepID=A0A0F2MBX0_SPOSC|nr:uncharacterized protein SPSK_02478 [Sporothrix schenckii 1099-18]KJR86335.1 hypothetical protein SPSK_02478 [Sporothrix schenckii 1099-18]
MHYIRLLRPPNVVRASPGQPASLALVLTITTDLGESFLCPDAPIDISVELVVDIVETVQEEPEEPDAEDKNGKRADAVADEDEDEDGEAPPKETVTTRIFELPIAAPTVASGGKGNKAGKQAKPSKTASNDSSLSWRAGKRVLKLEAKLPRAAEACLWDSNAAKRRICIRPADPSLSAVHSRQLVGTQRQSGEGLILPLWVDVPATSDEPFDHVALRRLTFSSKDKDSDIGGYVEVEEEIGESIARHVWDAGLVAVALLADTCLGNTPSRKRPREDDKEMADTKIVSLPDALRNTLLRQNKRRGLRVFELGSGVGILGIGLAAIVHEADQHKTASKIDTTQNTILLTDLPEAEERARANMARSAQLSLDYENLDWEDGRQGQFGPAAKDAAWDMILLSDCTYNVDMLPALVETLSALADMPSANRKKPGVLLARKPRHASEEVLFTLMTEHGWAVHASSTIPLPVLGNDAEVVEVYLYEKAQGGVHVVT